MKKLIFICLFFVFIAFSACESDEPQTVAVNWTLETVDNTISDIGMNRIAIDKDSGLHIAYVVPSGTVAKIKYAYKAYHGTWVTEVVDGDNNCDKWVDIAVDSSNKVYLVYVKNTSTGISEMLTLAEKTFGSATWATSVVQTEQNNSSNPRITIDKNYGIHISYSRGGSGTQQYAYRPQGGIFSYELLSDDGFANSDIVIDNQQIIHVVWYHGKKLKYASKAINATQWNVSDIQSNIEYGSSTTSAISLAFDKQNNLYSTYSRDYNSTDMVGLASKTAAANWSVTSVSQLKVGLFSFDLSIDNQNYKYVTYRDNVGADGNHFDLEIAYAKSNGVWLTQEIDGNSDSRCGYYTSVANGRDNSVNISYSANDDKILKFAYKKKID